MRERGLSWNAECCYWAMVACTRARQWDKSLEVLAAMREGDVAPDAASLKEALHVCRGARYWQEAIAFLLEMDSQSFEPDEAAFNKVMDACDLAEETEWFDYVEDMAAARGFELRI